MIENSISNELILTLSNLSVLMVSKNDSAIALSQQLPFCDLL